MKLLTDLTNNIKVADLKVSDCCHVSILRYLQKITLTKFAAMLMIELPNERMNEPTPWRRVPEKLTVTQLVMNFPAVYGTRRFMTVFTTAL
jgi:hypothetical protein